MAEPTEPRPVPIARAIAEQRPWRSTGDAPTGRVVTALGYGLAELRPCPALNDASREKGVVCAMFANGATCLGVQGECSEAEGGVWVATEQRLEPREVLRDGKTETWYRPVAE